MKLESYWLDTAPAFGVAAEGPIEGRADAVVIGAGFTGLSAALALAKAGADVVVLEARSVCAMASGRNGGHCNNGLSHDPVGLVPRFGLDGTRALYQAFDAAVDSVERIVAEESIDCSFHRCGKLKLAAKPAHLDRLARSQALIAREMDPETEILSRVDIRREVGTDLFHGGLLYRKAAALHVGRFGIGLAEAAARRGARIHEHAEVTGLDRENGAFSVTTTRGTVTAGQVLLATGAYTTSAFGYFRRRIVPVGSFIVATEPLAKDLLDRIMPGRRSLVTTKYVGNYVRVAPDDRLIFGGRARFAISSPESDAKSGRILERMMRRVFPDLDSTRIDYCWGGLVDMTRDRIPRAGEHDGIYYSLGYSGHGVQIAVHMGQVMARVMDGHPEANPFRDIPWHAIPGHFGQPWFLPLVGAWYRSLDLLT